MTSLSNCPCDEPVFPPELNISAGLTSIPRQIGTFGDFRRAMLASVRGKVALAAWRARDAQGSREDLGLLLLEMWAYACDVVSFYDEVIAHEVYIRTARQSSSLRMLTGLLSYRPRPAVAASVLLAAMADGRQGVVLPPGTAFRSAAFEGHPPQVFEVETAATISPFNNRWRLADPRPATLEIDNPLTLAVLPAQARLAVGQALLLQVLTQSGLDQVVQIAATVPATAPDGTRYTRLQLKTAARLPAATPFDQVQFKAPTQRAGLWTVDPSQPAIDVYFRGLRVTNQVSKGAKNGASATATVKSSSKAAILTEDSAGVNSQKMTSPLSGLNGATDLTPQLKDSATQLLRFGMTTQITLDGLYKQIHAGDLLLLSFGTEYRWFSAVEVQESMRPASAGTTVKINGTSFTTPGVSMPVTQIVLDVDINSGSRRLPGSPTWDDNQSAMISVHYGLIEAGTLLALSRSLLTPKDTLTVPGAPLEATPPVPDGGALPLTGAFLLEDKNGRGVQVGGSLNYTTGGLTLNQGAGWRPGLQLPVTLYGNAVAATRGESVPGEVLGSGNASLTNQTFKLKKKPLTYTAAPSTLRGVASTLKIFVDGVEWFEADSFYGARPDDPIYIVRHDDAQETQITFGNGQWGSRLPSGIDNVVAHYRFGAEKASPPAGAITQIVRPVKGLSSVRSPLAAVGGDDPEPAEKIRRYGPRSALLLGRAVSIQDMEAAAAGVAGVRAAQAQWRWNPIKARPVIQVWYIGSAGLEAQVSQRLRSLSDPATPIAVETALGIPVHLTVDVLVAPRFQPEKVLPLVQTALLEPENGLLAPERIGVGQPVFLSRVFAEVLAVPGVEAVRSILWDGQTFQEAGRSPGVGKYFDFEAGGVSVS